MPSRPDMYMFLRGPSMDKCKHRKNILVGLLQQYISLISNLLSSINDRINNGCINVVQCIKKFSTDLLGFGFKPTLIFFWNPSVASCKASSLKFFE